MTRFISVVSGKGGAGKTTTALNLGVALRNLGKEVVLFDGNFHSPNLGLRVGATNTPTTIHDVIHGNKPIFDSVYQHFSGVKIIPGDISLQAAKEMDTKKLKNAVSRLRGYGEIVIFDLAAGFNKENMELMGVSDEILVVTNPDISSVTDALKSITLADSRNKLVLGVVANRARGDEHELSKENMESLMGRQVISVIPDSEEIRRSHHQKQPIFFSHPGSETAERYTQLASMLMGEQIYKPSWFEKFLK